MVVLGIIPARGGSKGLKRKNLRLLNGRPLIDYTIEAALGSKMLTHILVTSEDEEILGHASTLEVEIQQRPQEHATDTAGVDKLLIFTVLEFEKKHQIKVDLVVLLYPTAPLRTSKVIDGCLTTFEEGSYDSLLTLYEDDKYLWKLDGVIAQPTNYNPVKRAPRQLEGWNQYAEDKSVYVMKRDLLIDTGCRLGGKIGYYLIDPLTAIDIDDERDLKLADLILKSKLLDQ